jgi:outer membrane biosynthesis protein TonB
MAEPEMTSRPTNDAYTGMLAIALLALIAGAALMYLDYSQYPQRAPGAILKAPPPPLKVEAPPPPPSEEKKDEPKKEDGKDDTKKEEMKKEDAKKEEMKKEDEKKDADKKDAEKKDAEKKDEKKESSSLGSPRPVSPLLELGVGVAQEDAPVLQRRRMLAGSDVEAEGTIDERPHLRARLHRQAG